MAGSLKECIQKMQMKDGGYYEGIVVRASPLELRLVNQEDFPITESMLIVPQHLRDYTVNADVSGLKVNTPDGSGTAAGSCTITIKNALAEGDRVALFGYDLSKSYYILGRL